jgi:N-acetylneuraminate lyase
MVHSITGLVAAVFTPMHGDGSLNLDQVGPIVDHLESIGTRGIYVVGSTGEGMSLTGRERRGVAEAYTAAAQGRMRVIIQVGHNSIREARNLAQHAQQIGADVVSATAPSYFKPASVRPLVESMAEIAAGAPDLPFYYYHVPGLTGAGIDMVDFLHLAPSRIPNLVGIKFTQPALDRYQACAAVADGRFDLLWGIDEMLLSALAVGAKGAVGSTYNFLGPLYQQVISAFQAGDMAAAREHQTTAVKLVHLLIRHGGAAAIKAVMQLIDLDCGPVRLPLEPLDGPELAALEQELDAAGFFDWIELRDAQSFLRSRGYDFSGHRLH